MNTWTIVVAGGSGARFGGAKQFAKLGDRTVLDLSVATALTHSHFVVVVVPAEEVSRVAAHFVADTAVVVVGGGATRSGSVRNGLHAVADDAEIVLVHDAARPFASGALYESVIAAVATGSDAAVPGVPVTDTIKQITGDGVVVTTPERASLVAVQTPQGFSADALRRAHERGGNATDDAALVEAMGGHVIVVPGEAVNRKITTPEDLTWAEGVLSSGGVQA
jgi:2-C-methyl-D-erythritol 4-phosphate cytidylyltransferase